MDIFKLITDIQKVDPEVYDRLDSRRRVFKHLTGVSKTVAAAAVPGFLAAVFNKAYAQGGGLPNDIAAVLNFALKLEYLEATFYTKGVATSGLIPAGAGLTALTTIRDDENKHVAFLRSVLGSQAIAPLVEGTQNGNFDFTGSKGGTRPALFADVFSNYQTFLAVAQSFEDTGVRAYKGGAPLLKANDTVLRAALNIHSVEARHASHLRTMRRGGPGVAGAGTGASPKSWITGTEGGGAGGAATAPIYGAGAPPANFPAEDNVTQVVNLQTTLAAFNFPASAFSEAFDEPLDSGTVTAIALNFVVGNTF